MGWWCRICGRTRPNERFTGRGRRNHICKECQKLPKKEREAIDHERELLGYLRQKHISTRNCLRLRELTHDPRPGLAALAQVILEVAALTPHRRKRYGYLARHAPDLLWHLNELTGLGFCPWDDDAPAPDSLLIDVPTEDDACAPVDPEDMAHLLVSLDRWEPVPGPSTDSGPAPDLG